MDDAIRDSTPKTNYDNRRRYSAALCQKQITIIGDAAFFPIIFATTIIINVACINNNIATMMIIALMVIVHHNENFYCKILKKGVDQNMPLFF